MILTGRPEGEENLVFNFRGITQLKGKVPLSQYVAFIDNPTDNPLEFEGCTGFIPEQTTPAGRLIGRMMETGDTAEINASEPGKAARIAAKVFRREPNVKVEGITPTYSQAVRELFN